MDYIALKEKSMDILWQEITPVNGHFEWNGEDVIYPEFPYEFFPSSVAMDGQESGAYLHDLLYRLKSLSEWNNIIPLCPKCYKVAKFCDNVDDTNADMAILHSLLADWALNHDCEGQIRNADNILVKLKCGCKLTIKDKIFRLPKPNNSEYTTDKIDYAYDVFAEFIKIVKTDEKIAELVKEFKKDDKKFLEDMTARFDTIFGDILREDYCSSIRPKVESVGGKQWKIKFT